jgi:hypothetical protein
MKPYLILLHFFTFSLVGAQENNLYMLSQKYRILVVDADTAKNTIDKINLADDSVLVSKQINIKNVLYSNIDSFEVEQVLKMTRGSPNAFFVAFLHDRNVVIPSLKTTNQSTDLSVSNPILLKQNYLVLMLSPLPFDRVPFFVVSTSNDDELQEMLRIKSELESDEIGVK